MGIIDAVPRSRLSMKYSVSLILIVSIGAVLAWYLFQPRTQVIPGDVSPEKESIQEEPKEREKVEAIQESIEKITDGLTNLAKDFDNKPPFTVERVWVERDRFYVEYKNQTGTLAQLLVLKDGEDYKGIGYFSPSESGWVLQAGEGKLASPSATLYERDEEGEWRRRN